MASTIDSVLEFFDHIERYGYLPQLVRGELSKRVIRMLCERFNVPYRIVVKISISCSSKIP